VDTALVKTSNLVRRASVLVFGGFTFAELGALR
jgi:hypothetical protein